MPSSGYTVITFVADELLTSSKMNDMAGNDVSFNSGNGFEDGIIVNRHIAAGALYTSKVFNPYKFSAKRSAAYNTANSATTKFPYEAEDYDTGSNYDATTNFRYTAPVNQFMHFDATIAMQNTNGAFALLMFYKNGVEVRRPYDIRSNTAQNFSGSIDLQLTAGDYVEVFYFVGGVIAAQSNMCIFSGHMISAT